LDAELPAVTAESEGQKADERGHLSNAALGRKPTVRFGWEADAVMVRRRGLLQQQEADRKEHE
jgi:hypothetical protein